MKKNIKSKAKALGLKSTLVFNDQVVLTSFAKGQDKKNNNIEKTFVHFAHFSHQW